MIDRYMCIARSNSHWIDNRARCLDIPNSVDSKLRHRRHHMGCLFRRKGRRWDSSMLERQTSIVERVALDVRASTKEIPLQVQLE